MRGILIAVAYIGPGAGIGAVGSLIAVAGAGVLTVVGLVWYPVRRLLRFRRSRRQGGGERDDNGPGGFPQ